MGLGVGRLVGGGFFNEQSNMGVLVFELLSFYYPLFVILVWGNVHGIATAIKLVDRTWDDQVSYISTVYFV